MKLEPPLSIDGAKSAQPNQVFPSGIVKGIMNKIIITAGKIILVRDFVYFVQIFSALRLLVQ